MGSTCSQFNHSQLYTEIRIPDNFVQLTSEIEQSNYMNPEQRSIKLIRNFIQTYGLSEEDFDFNKIKDYTVTAETQEQIIELQPQNISGFMYYPPLGARAYYLNPLRNFYSQNYLEWPISYHGINTPGFVHHLDPSVIFQILENRLLKAGTRQLYSGQRCYNPLHIQECTTPRSCVYSSNQYQIASQFCNPTFVREELNRFKVCLQIRINPQHLHIVKPQQHYQYFMCLQQYLVIQAVLLLQQRNQPEPLININ